MSIDYLLRQQMSPSFLSAAQFWNSVVAEPSTSQKLLKFCGGRTVHLTETSEFL